MNTPEEIFDLALREHQAGRIDQAESFYRRVLELAPQHADAWHLLGVAAYQQGCLPQAIEAIQRAVQFGPPNEAYFSNLGAALLNAGRVAEAIASFREALRLRPHLSEAHNNLGNAFKAQGEFDQARASYLQAIEFNPRSLLAHHNLAIACREMNRRDEALEHLRISAELAPGADLFNELGSWLGEWGDLDGAIEQFRLAVQARPNWDVAHFNLGGALKLARRWDEAAQSLRAAVALRADFVEALTQLGEVLFKQGHAAEAEAVYLDVLRLRPDCPIALTNLGVIYQHGRRPEDAERNFRAALRASPDFIDAINNLGAVLRDLGQLDAAADVCRRGLELAPNDSDIHANLGAVALDRCDFEMALAEYGRAVQLRPDCADAHFNRSMVQLLCGDFEHGWEGYEWRWKTGQLSAWRGSDRPLWNGEPLHGRTILLHAEQGLGDTLQLVRYAALVQQRGGRVLLECQSSLVRLLRRTPGIDEFVDSQTPLPAFDVQLPLLSLPRVFGTRLETIPAQIPYVFADDSLQAHWRPTLGNDSALKVGLVWQGAPTHRRDRFRSVPLAALAPLAGIAGVSLFSLQKGAGSEQLNSLSPAFPLVDLGQQVDDFADLAALACNLDLLISIDSAPAHLAGAMGLPTWVLVPAAPDWRWLSGREDSPWYPTARLWRQRELGEWREVIERVAAELTRRAAAHRPADDSTAESTTDR